MTLGNIDELPFVGAAYRRPRPPGVVPNLLVLHSGETNEGRTAAEGMAAFFASGNTTGSTQLCVDNDSGVRCAHDWERTNGAGGVNAEALHIEQAGRAGQSEAEWNDDYSKAVVENAADACRQWIAKFPHIRPVFLTGEQLATGERNGITTHNECSRVFAGNDGHWDPGPEYPIGRLLGLIRGAPPQTKRGRRGMYLHAETGSGSLKWMAGLRWVMAPNGRVTRIDQPQWAKYANTGEIYIGDAQQIAELLGIPK